jgi:RNA polymerase subunit RPABC4/transcription elongation factor Spt4
VKEKTDIAGARSYIKVHCPKCGEHWDAVIDDWTDIATYCECGEKFVVDYGGVLIVFDERRGSRRWICSSCGASQSAPPLANAEDLCTVCGRRGMVASWKGVLIVWDEKRSGNGTTDTSYDW